MLATLVYLGLLAQEEIPPSAAARPWIDWSLLTHQLVTATCFIILGLAFFSISDWLVDRVMPRSLRKAIDEDRNMALAIVVGASILGIAWIVAAAIHG